MQASPMIIPITSVCERLVEGSSAAGSDGAVAISASTFGTLTFGAEGITSAVDV